MSTITAGTTSGTALQQAGDTTGTLVFKTNDSGSGGTTALTLATNQNATFAGSIVSPTITSPTISSPTISGTPVMSASVITSATAQASTSGTSIDFTSIPSWVKRITIMLSGVSLSGTSLELLQIGAGSVANTGYLSTSTYLNGAGGATTTATTGFVVNSAGTATYAISGIVTLALINSSTNLWVASGFLAFDNTAYTIGMAGTKTLSGTLDRVRITSINGTDTFDAGSINILYE